MIENLFSTLRTALENVDETVPMDSTLNLTVLGQRDDALLRKITNLFPNGLKIKIDFVPTEVCQIAAHNQSIMPV